MLKITTAGESHGKGLFAVIEGLPAGLEIDTDEIDRRLAARQEGYGRGARQKIERDKSEILSGVRNRCTLGSPVTVAVYNRDYENWKAYMAPEGCDVAARRLTKVRPGHADLTGMIKFGQTDARNVLERSSARETAVRVAAGTICRTLLERLNIRIAGYVRSVGGACDENEYTFEEILADRRPALGMMSAQAEEKAVQAVDRAKERGDTLGGVIELRIKGLKSGFGSCMTYAEKLDARFCAALMSVQAVKGVEVGLGFEAARLTGSAVHDEIFYDGDGYYRKTNRAGGIEGGMSNGEEIVLRAAMKPIPTLMQGLNTVDTATKEAARAATERSDVCAVFACECVLESVLAAELLSVVLERLGGDTVAEIAERYGRLPQ